MAGSRIEDSSITDVKNGFDSGTPKIVSTPFVQLLVRNTVRRWKAKHEALINKRIERLKFEKKKRRTEDMVSAFPESRRISLDVLAREWMEENPITLDVRVYLIEKLFPYLIMGLEKLLTEVEKRELVASESVSSSFNPVNYLAQYLMRNNPIYSNFPEASPYAKGLRKVAEDLKSEIFGMDNNRLAKLKAEAQQKRLEREKVERMKGVEKERRSELLEDLFVVWAQNEGTISLAVIQNALHSFLEYSETLPDIIRRETHFAIKLPEIDSTGKLLGVGEFKEVLGEVTISLSNEAFEKFMEHLAKCAHDFQQAAERVTIRYSLKSLFLACDHDAVGVLDRKRVLEILGNYYDSSTESVRKTLRNPRKWPIVDVEECEEEAIDDELTEGDEKEAKIEEYFKENSLEKQEELHKHNKTEGAFPEAKNAEIVRGKQVMAEQEKQEAVAKDGKSFGKAETKVSVTGVGGEEKPLDEDEGRHSKIGAEEKEEESQSKTGVRTKLAPSDSEEELSSASSHSLGRPHSVTTGSAFDENLLNQTQFVNLCEQFLGDEPVRSALDSLVRFIRASYSETDEERVERQEKARLEARINKRKYMVEQLFDFWDVDRSGTLNFQDVIDVLSKWKDISASPKFQEFMDTFTDMKKELTCIELHDYIDSICNACFPDEDPFEAIVIFLHTSIERTFEERKRGEARKAWLNKIDSAAKTSGGVLEPVYEATFDALLKDAEAHGRDKVISSSVSLLESNMNPDKQHRGATVLRYVASTPHDAPFVLRKCLYRDMRTVSFAAVDSGKPIHVAKVHNHPGVHLWNPERRATGATGSLIVLPLKDHEKRVIGILAVDTVDDPHEKSVFITHEISFYQGVAKALSQGMQFVDIRSKTVKIADSALSWIHRRSQSVQNSNFYLVEPGLHPSDGLVLRKMFTINSNRTREYYEDPGRMNRKDNLFRDYLFKCVESSETITADAYGERHVAFPIRDAEGVAIGVVDISIGDVKVLAAHEMKEIQKMLRLLAMAHREVAGEIAGHQKNIVLEVEKANEDLRIEILFDRLMLTDLRENVARLDARAFAEIKSYKDPPKLVHDILKTVLGIFHTEEEGKFESWPTCKLFINADLVKMITQYDPTAASSIMMVDGKKLSDTLEGISPGTVAKQGSLPAQYLFNWAFVCLSLIEHTAKMNVAQPMKPASAADSNPEELAAPTSQTTEPVKSKLNGVTEKATAD